MGKIINSPFKFLDPYGREDADIFFGRDTEIKELYQHIHKNRLVLVYGTSGTGKTSIVQCGLMNRMDDTDWTPFIVRRAENINESLCSLLEQAITGTSEGNVTNALQGNRTNTMNMIRPKMAVDGVCEKIYTSLTNINLRYLRPVYLIFDQFEELLIMGTESERRTFITIIDKILSSSELQFCNLLFIMREEFFAGLSEFEKEIPDFCDRRLRIEPMNPKKVEEVILRSCEKFNIELKEGSENAKQIINVLTEKNTVSLPYLQIYLDQLWRTVYMNTGFKVLEVGEEFPQISIDAETIKRFGHMNDVLNRFIKERITVIQETLHNEFADIPEDFVSNVLDAFVTPEGTKRPLAYLRINNGIWFTGQVAPYLQKKSGQLMIRCLTELDKNKILRTDGQTYELAHDVLAGLIDNRRTEDQRKAGFTDQQIRSRFTGFKEKASDHLTRKELESYKPYLEQLNLAPEIMDFYNASAAVRDNEERENAEREEQEAQESADREKKLAYLKARQRKMKWGWVAGGALLISSTALYLYSETLKKEFNRNESLVYMGYEMKSLNPVEALNLFGPIKEKVYGDDTMKVNAKMLEFMQLQAIQGLFSKYNYTLDNPILNIDNIDISADGKYMILANDREENRNSSRKYILLNDTGGVVKEFANVTYAYFTNKDDILLLCSKETENENVQFTAGKKQAQHYSPETPLPKGFTFYNCKTGNSENITLGPRRFLHGPEDVAPGPPFTTYDSYRVRYTASGNIIVPFLEMSDYGDLLDKVTILSPGKTPIAYLPSQYTVTTSPDLTKIITLYSPPGAAGVNHMDVYDEDGRLIKKIVDMVYADFTEDGELIWGDDDKLKVLKGADTLSFSSSDFPYSYGYGNTVKNRLIARTSLGVDLINMQNKTTQTFTGSLIATNFEKNAFMMEVREGRNFGFSRKIRDEKTLVHDTIWRRDLEGKTTAVPFTHPDGIETIQYNRAADELLVLTKKNKLLLLDKDLRVKTGLLLTANDRYGIAENGGVFYYVRDQYLSVFRNELGYLNVFDANKVWALLARPKSPVKMDISKQRRKELGLRFK